VEELMARQESLELKWAGEKDAEAYKHRTEEERRQSLAQRNQQARRAREIEEDQRQAALQQEHASYELNRAAAKDVNEYIEQMAKDRRDSLAFRNKEAKNHRDLEEKLTSEQLLAAHESYELRWAAEKDAEAYRLKMDEERRQSLKARNAHARKQRERASDEVSQALQKEHESFELKWTGEKDAEAYLRQEEQARRESLKFRNSEALRHAQVMSELHMLALEQERESLVLKWAGEDDAKAHLDKMDAERRQALQLRAQQWHQQREVEQAQREVELHQQQVKEELRAIDQKAVEAYNKACAARDRASFEYRGKASRIIRLEDEERRYRERKLETANSALEGLARSDVEEYVKECKQRRRMSLAFRAKEHRQARQWRFDQAESDRVARSREVSARLADQRSAEQARHEERVRKTMDAIQHSGCSFNPFLGLLD
jgi:hypothetical protein